MTTPSTLRVRWRDVLYDVLVCLDAERLALAQSLWPGGVVDLAQVLDPSRPETFGLSERRALVKQVLRALGELPPRVPLPWPAEQAPTSPGAFASAATTRAVVAAGRRLPRVDHATLGALLLSSGRVGTLDTTNHPGVREVKS